METATIIVAAGRGTRAPSAERPKQYRLLSGEPVLARALKSFSQARCVGAILPVIHEDDRELFDAAKAAASVSGKLLEPVTGGVTRQESVYRGLQQLEALAPKNVFIHDAARPFVSPELIERVYRGLENSHGVVPALPVTDTLKLARDGKISRTVDRAHLWRAQTPQGFRYDRILEAHRSAERRGTADFTDDSSLAEWHGMVIELVEGEETNMKLTTNEDFAIAESHMKAISGNPLVELRIGQGFDVHAFTDGDGVTLCGIKIPHDRSLKGHSDADVGLHAITDALLGAIADGDIGAHFSPGDPKWSGASSDLFLRDAATRIDQLRGHIINVDVTIICERPKISPHRDAMRGRVAEILGLDPARVSVKATTTEGLGFTGRGEGIVAQAIVMVRFE